MFPKNLDVSRDEVEETLRYEKRYSQVISKVKGHKTHMHKKKHNTSETTTVHTPPSLSSPLIFARNSLVEFSTFVNSS